MGKSTALSAVIVAVLGIIAWMAYLLIYAMTPTPMGEQRNSPAEMVISPENSRIEVTRVSVFTDDLAFNQKRGVYLIKDTKTGKEYIGISGVGIQEVGSHNDGRMGNTDER